MKPRFIDLLLVTVLVSLPLFSFMQACSGGGPTVPSNPDRKFDPDKFEPPKFPDNDDDPPPPVGDNHAPTAVLSVVGPEDGPTPFIVTLDASASYDPDDDPLEYSWWFSDGGYAAESVVQHEFTTSGRQWAKLAVIDDGGLAGNAGPVDLWAWGLANSPWPKFAHDSRNSGITPNSGPVLMPEDPNDEITFPRTWTGGTENDLVNAICVSYDGDVIYTQGKWLRARTPDGATLWDLQVESSIIAWPAIAHDGGIVIATIDGWVHRIKENGEILWSTNLNDATGLMIVPQTGINIGNDGSIYLGAYVPSFQGAKTGVLAALALDGTFRWFKTFQSFMYQNPSGAPEPGSLVPAILGNGNIVINGVGGKIYTPDGDLVKELDIYDPYYGTRITEPLGPPSVSEDGIIVFTNRYAPAYLEDGSFLTLYFPFENYFDPGFTQAPVSDGRTIDLLSEYTSPNYIHLFTRLEDGGTGKTFLGPDSSNFSIVPRAIGASRDMNGTLFTSSYKLHALSLPRVFSTSPYPYAHRYSLWSYGEAQHMTAPVVGLDRWLYVGYDKDILAVGD